MPGMEGASEVTRRFRQGGASSRPHQGAQMLSSFPVDPGHDLASLCVDLHLKCRDGYGPSITFESSNVLLESTETGS
jgi:hypothetical protein